MSDTAEASKPTGLPGRAEVGGHIYVIEFDNSSIKVGRTANPRQRIAQHKQAANSVGVALARRWISPLHEEYRANEDRLIVMASELGALASGPECFTGLSFSLVVERAQRLPFTPVDPEQQAKDGGAGLVDRLSEPRLGALRDRRDELQDQLRQARQAIDAEVSTCLNDGLMVASIARAAGLSRQAVYHIKRAAEEG